jgi:hypothetical protein
VSVPQSESAAATASPVAWVSWKPRGPVQRIRAAGVQDDRTQPPGGQHLLVHSTGAALTWLRVKTPAARSRAPR